MPAALEPRCSVCAGICAVLLACTAASSPAGEEPLDMGGDDDLGPGPTAPPEPVRAGTSYTLWIHGRNPDGVGEVGNYDDFGYWGSAEMDAGINKKAVNWGGTGRIAASNEPIRWALDCFCTGENWCYIAAHSAGDAQIGYALDVYGGTKRRVTDARPDASGFCGDTGRKQVGWNIRWVDVAGGAAGGSELANIGDWAVSDPLTSDLRTQAARSLYDHNNTHGVMFRMFAGAQGTASSGVLPGQDDKVIAYHSAGGLSKSGRFCNPGDWFCDGTLPYDQTPAKKDGDEIPKWNMHSVDLRDDGEDYDHFTDRKWNGIVSVVVQDVFINANQRLDE